VLFPGGFGTLDEGLENLTLVQTGKSKPRPIILIEPPDSQYWNQWIDFVTQVLVERGFVSHNDMGLFIHVNTVEKAIDEILQFYKVYHSIRYVGNKTVVRLKLLLNSKNIEELNKKYADILRSGEIKLTESLPAEQKGEEFPDLPRLVMDFNRHDYGKFYEMLKFLNTLRC
jgi:hypothetical protein